MRDNLLTWVRDMGWSLGFVIVIHESKMEGKYAILGCENGGKFK